MKASRNKKRKANDGIVDYKKEYEHMKRLKEAAEREKEAAEREKEAAEREKEAAERENEKLKAVLEVEKDERLSFFSTRMLPSSGKHSRASKRLKSFYSVSGKKKCLFCEKIESENCMISSAHIVAGTDQKDYSTFGKKNHYSSELDFKSERNFIPLCGTLGATGTCHDYFDKYLMTLIYNPLKKEYSIYCLVKDSPLHNKVVQVNEGHRPYTRLLSWRLKACIQQHPALIEDEVRDLYLLGNLSEDSKSKDSERSDRSDI
jgi:hypothetical protein